MAPLRSSRELYPDAQLGESIVALKTSIMCQELGLKQVILEGDALFVLNEINNLEEKWISVGMIIRDVKDLMEKVAHWTVWHVSRNINKVAHALS